VKEFEYYGPASLDEVLSLLERHGGDAKVLAGGTDLMVQMKSGKVSPAVVIDIKKVPELQRLEWDYDRGLFIGAAVSISRMASLPAIASRYELLLEACSLIGSFQLRSRATVGGNICNGAPSADSAPPLLSLEARAIAVKRGATRTIPLSDFFLGPGKTALTPVELLAGIEIPTPPVPSSGAYLRHIPRQEMDIAVAGVSSFLLFEADGESCREARIALGAVAPTPVRARAAEAVLQGAKLTEEVLREASERAAAEARPITDVRGSASYRREIVGVLTRRTLGQALRTASARRVP
jgi:carbon-monoxide dehydrogenase medium subunit